MHLGVLWGVVFLVFCTYDWECVLFWIVLFMLGWPMPIMCVMWDGLFVMCVVRDCIVGMYDVFYLGWLFAYDLAFMIGCVLLGMGVIYEGAGYTNGACYL